LLEGLVCWVARKSVGSKLPAFFYVTFGLRPLVGSNFGFFVFVSVAS